MTGAGSEDLAADGVVIALAADMLADGVVDDEPEHPARVRVVRTARTLVADTDRLITEVTVVALSRSCFGACG